ncbi:Tyrosine-protein kinase [hydrothermal vent metagenome]|uniref:non-specific protein-tyrosine kinase n=1 Tax=hydrothermal vent metagenome TaxID=652676 RepID=A0A3B1AK25_9ZZZZ
MQENKAQQPLEEDEIDLREYWRVIMRHKSSIFGLAFLAAILSALVVFAMKPIYSSTVTLLIEPGSANVVSIEDVYGDSDTSTYYKTQHEILESRLLITKVIAKLNLQENPEFLPDESEPLISIDWRAWIKELLPDNTIPEEPGIDEYEAFNAELIKDFSARLSVAPVRKSQLVKISFEANNRKLAAQVANTLANTYIESDMEARLEMTSTASNWLTERLVTLKSNLQQSENELQAYREKEELLEAGGVSTLSTRQLQDLNEKLVLATQQRATAEISLKQIKSLAGESPDKLGAIPAVLNDDLVGSLKHSESDMQREVSALAKRYGPMHPEMIQAKANLAKATQNVNRRIRSVTNGVEKEYQIAMAAESSLKRSLQRAKGEMQNINRKGYKLGVLEREVESNRQLYKLFLNRFKETKETSGLEQVRARIVDPAEPSIKPIKPKKQLIVLIATLISGFLGILLAFLFEHLDNTIKKASDLEDRLHLPVLGLLPKLDLKKHKTASPLSYAKGNKQSFFSESIRTIRTAMLLSGLDDPYKVILVTSSVPGEGKSAVATTLAESMGELHKVLLIDADMRRPTIAKTWDFDPRSPGLSEFIAESAQLSECVYQIQDSNVHIMPSGTVPPNPLALLSSNRFTTALDHLGKNFDHIIIDSAPCLAVSDALVLSRCASGVILVVKADATPYPVAQDAIKRLHQSNARIIGGVLNNVSKSKKGGYGNYGKYSYYDGCYYGSYGYTND